MSSPPLRILGICGSLRDKSRNRQLLAAAIELAPPALEFSLAEIGTIPLYNGDVEAGGFPAPVTAFHNAIEAADGLLIATPEYNHSIPGVLKNALDWASRGRQLITKGKPVGVIGASNGPIGTARCQAHLRLVLYTLRTLVMPHGEVLVGMCNDRFDDQGRLTDEKSREILAGYLEAFAEWAAWVRSRPA